VEQRKKRELGEIPEVWGEQNKSCDQMGKGHHKRKGHQEVSIAAVNMNWNVCGLCSSAC